MLIVTDLSISAQMVGATKPVGLFDCATTTELTISLSRSSNSSNSSDFGSQRSLKSHSFMKAAGCICQLRCRSTQCQKVLSFNEDDRISSFKQKRGKLIKALCGLKQCANTNLSWEHVDVSVKDTVQRLEVYGSPRTKSPILTCCCSCSILWQFFFSKKSFVRAFCDI